MLLNKAQRADVCDDEAHFSTGVVERMRTLLLEFLSGDRSTDTDCVVKDTHPGFGPGPFSVLASFPMLDSVSNLLLIALTP